MQATIAHKPLHLWSMAEYMQLLIKKPTEDACWQTTQKTSDRNESRSLTNLHMFLEVGDVFKACSTSLTREGPQSRVSAHVARQCTPVNIATVTVRALEWFRAIEMLLLGVFTKTRCTHEWFVAEFTRMATFLAFHTMNLHVLWQIWRIRESFAADWTAVRLHVLVVEFHMLTSHHITSTIHWRHYCINVCWTATYDRFFDIIMSQTFFSLSIYHILPFQAERMKHVTCYVMIMMMMLCFLCSSVTAVLNHEDSN